MTGLHGCVKYGWEGGRRTFGSKDSAFLAIRFTMRDAAAEWKESSGTHLRNGDRVSNKCCGYEDGVESGT